MIPDVSSHHRSLSQLYSVFDPRPCGEMASRLTTTHLQSPVLSRDCRFDPCQGQHSFCPLDRGLEEQRCLFLGGWRSGIMLVSECALEYQSKAWNYGD